MGWVLEFLFTTHKGAASGAHLSLSGHHLGQPGGNAPQVILLPLGWAWKLATWSEACKKWPKKHSSNGHTQTLYKAGKHLIADARLYITA